MKTRQSAPERDKATIVRCTGCLMPIGEIPPGGSIYDRSTWTLGFVSRCECAKKDVEKHPEGGSSDE